MTRTRHVAPDAAPTARCGSCGYARNPYRHGKCPACYVDDGDGYWLGCDRCGYDWLQRDGPTATECPRCDADAHAVAELRAP